MTKYARLVAGNSPEVPVYVVDLFTTDANDRSTPMKIPQDTPDQIEWLTRVVAGLKVEEFEHFDEQFKQVPAGVKPSARFTGDRANLADVMDGAKYQNSDGTDGGGNPM